METWFAQSARRHKVGRAHARHVINTVEAIVGTSDRGDVEYAWKGDDDRGLELEIVGILQGERIMIIHVMPTALRRK